MIKLWLQNISLGGTSSSLPDSCPFVKNTHRDLRSFGKAAFQDQVGISSKAGDRNTQVYKSTSERAKYATDWKEATLRIYYHKTTAKPKTYLTEQVQYLLLENHCEIGSCYTQPLFRYIEATTMIWEIIIFPDVNRKWRFSEACESPKAQGRETGN